MWADEAALDAAGRRLDEWESAVADRAAKAKALSERVRALTGTASSPDRMVEVTVDAAGSLTDLWLDERVRQQSAARTAQQILATTRAAHADLLRQVTAAASDTLGDGDPAAEAVVDSYRRRRDTDPGSPDARR
ncbi:YbaB/EbfC family nucleoid-associated protein [Micromonospora sp. WMMD558]|uniref:YbaB/EbfC family nucleoid-associated protein n=1 Tax=unclassified Micromonospora TaxID=2617518 RepID=UPI0012B48B5F|nr:YbaB/EbfC family nucleoid-associated protein [Micromonospora sp. WMMC415]QGN48654.1 YbaB/EbfC family DNA-binding protein [Micromonospora sp. WMMC415]